MAVRKLPFAFRIYLVDARRLVCGVDYSFKVDSRSLILWLDMEVRPDVAAIAFHSMEANRWEFPTRGGASRLEVSVQTTAFSG